MTSILKVDTQTLEDLDILPDTHSFSLLNLLNINAKTTDAKLILKSAIVSPLCNLNAIIEKQTEINFVINHIEKFSSAQFDDRIIYNCRDYLNSNIVGIKAPNRQNAFMHTWRYRKFIPELASGIYNMLSLIAETTKFVSIFQCNPPQGIGTYLNIFSDYSKEIQKCSIYKNKNHDKLSETDILILDYVFRVRLLEQSKSLITALAAIDALIAMAKFNIDYQLVFPQISQNRNANSSVKIEELRHITISQCVPNTIQLNESQNMIYLTGPNMSGKSSLLKAFGWAVYLAHLGMGVPAKAMSLTVFDEIVSSINNVDKTSDGQSYFLSEVRRAKAIAGKVVSDKNVLVICDELFKGTNSIDASDCTLAVVEGFAARKNSIFLIASHIHTIRNKICGKSSIGWFHFDGLITNDTPTYSYILKEGISEQRYGCLILKNEGVCDLLKTQE